MSEITFERLQQIEVLCENALNEPTDKRPPYGDTSGRIDLEMALVVLANLEHEDASQEHQDTLYVELRRACQEIAILRETVAIVPELVSEIRILKYKRTGWTP